jgi:hypothetical protein
MILVELEAFLKEMRAKKMIFFKTLVKVIPNLTSYSMDRKNSSKKAKMPKNIKMAIVICMHMAGIDRTLCKIMNKILKKSTCKIIRKMDIKRDM